MAMVMSTLQHLCTLFHDLYHRITHPPFLVKTGSCCALFRKIVQDCNCIYFRVCRRIAIKISPELFKIPLSVPGIFFLCIGNLALTFELRWTTKMATQATTPQTCKHRVISW